MVGRGVLFIVKYLIRETVTYEVEAADVREALDKVLNTDGGLVAHFTGVEQREIFEDGKYVEEPDMNW